MNSFLTYARFSPSMGELPKTKDALIEELNLERFEYVADIGESKKYGMGFSGYILVDGDEIRVLGSVVLSRGDGEPVVSDKGTSFVAYPDGMINDHVRLLDGEDAVRVARHLSGISNFDDYEEADISEDAR